MDTSREYIKMCDCPEIQGKYKRTEWDDKDFVKWKAGHMTWLPRQDQIQNMCHEYFAQEMGSKRPHDEWFPKGDIGLGYVFNGFIKFASDYMREIYNSFEQLWLAFYMYEKHSKVWDGNQWLKKE